MQEINIYECLNSWDKLYIQLQLIIIDLTDIVGLKRTNLFNIPWVTFWVDLIKLFAVRLIFGETSILRTGNWWNQMMYHTSIITTFFNTGN